MPTQTRTSAQKSKKPYEVKRSSAGLGLYALKTFKRGERVIEYTGENITEDEANRRGGQYLFNLGKKVTLDGRGREHTARYINHSCKPNCRAEINESNTRVFIFARRKIEPGEELTYNYGKEFWNEYIKPKGCQCASCRANARTA